LLWSGVDIHLIKEMGDYLELESNRKIIQGSWEEVQDPSKNLKATTANGINKKNNNCMIYLLKQK